MTQVELTLESFGPFTPGQLYYGYCPSRDGTQALVFAAYRKIYSTGETADWATAHVVLPDFAIWLGQTTPVAPGVWLHEQGDAITALIWDGASELPLGIMSREVVPGSLEVGRQELLKEVSTRFGSEAGPVRTWQGAVVLGSLGQEGLSLSVEGQTTVLSRGELRVIDVRDKAELSAQRGRGKRDRVLWLTFASALAGLAACLVAEAGLQLSNQLATRQRRGLEANSEGVRQIEQANQLAGRMEGLAGQSLRPFEMLAVLNNARPASMEFVRAATGGPRQMEIEAQSGNATDPQDYEKALRNAPGVEQVELRDFRTMAGKTTFLVAVTFKPGFAGQGVAR